LTETSGRWSTDAYGATDFPDNPEEGQVYRSGTLHWYSELNVGGFVAPAGEQRNWRAMPSLVALAHELNHAYYHAIGRWGPLASDGMSMAEFEIEAIKCENRVRKALRAVSPGMLGIWPRLGWLDTSPDIDADNVWSAWEKYDESMVYY
jgi:hypothetical protein